MSISNVPIVYVFIHHIVDQSNMTSKEVEFLTLNIIFHQWLN